MFLLLTKFIFVTIYCKNLHNYNTFQVSTGLSDLTCFQSQWLVNDEIKLRMPVCMFPVSHLKNLIQVTC